MLDKAIIFDLDGTLWDTSIEIEQVWKEVAENYNIKINQEKIKQIMGFTKDEIIEYLFKGNSEEGNEFITKCQENQNKYLKKNGGHIYKNTIKTIKDLSNNYNLYIVSNCQSGYIEAFLEQNSKLNLISKNDEKFLWEKHIFDSLAIEKFFEKFYRILDFKNSKRSEKFFKNAIKFSLD